MFSWEIRDKLLKDGVCDRGTVPSGEASSGKHHFILIVIKRTLRASQHLLKKIKIIKILHLNYINEITFCVCVCVCIVMIAIYGVKSDYYLSL